MNEAESSAAISSAEKFLAQGEPLLAYDAVDEILTRSPENVRLRQLQGLALARSGATLRANSVLGKLRDEKQADEETLGMLARTFKDLSSTAANPQERKTLLKRAAEIYGEAYEKTAGCWSGINAATLNLILGEAGRAQKLVREVRTQCMSELKNSRTDCYWALAVLGEAALVANDLNAAADFYARAGKEAKGRFGDVESSRRNARLILKHWNKDPAWIDRYLQIPNVIVFAGHMIDRPDRTGPRFPSRFEQAVATKIRDTLDQLDAGFGFASAACGSDILFLEAMLDRGGQVSIVLPYDQEQFVRDSVDFIPKSNWRTRFDRVIDNADRVVIASPQKLEIGGVAYQFGNDLLFGLATIRAHQLNTNLTPLAVWDGKTGDGPGGTASAIQNWRRAGYKPTVIDVGKLQNIKKPRTTKRLSLAKSSRTGKSRFGARVVTILFADATGFSKLTEAEVPLFVQHFLGTMAKLSEKFADSILARNTWGDGIYFVLSDIDVAGNFALQLADAIAHTNWEKKGLPADIGLRVGLHAGPAYEFDDPITGNHTFSGTHVSRAARIEPITPRGQVYASEAFAALAAARETKTFVCDYVGQTSLAKRYGTLPTYHVRRTG